MFAMFVHVSQAASPNIDKIVDINKNAITDQRLTLTCIYKTWRRFVSTTGTTVL